VHPAVKITRLVARIGAAAELASITAAVGLAQNLAALRAMAAEGIQRGHMRMHARNVAAEAGAIGDDIDAVASTIAELGTINVDAARSALLEREARRVEASAIPDVYRRGCQVALLERFSVLRQAYWPQIDALLQSLTKSTAPEASSLVAMCAYHMETGGKRLRALLPLLVAEALDKPADLAVPLGAACEMLHNATLVHDDLQDGDMVRRGRMTVWNRFGVPQAINLGDAMFYWSVLLCQRIDAPLARREALSRRLLVDTLRVIDGQEREFALKAADRVSLDDYFTMVEGKTSGLFALPMAGAAELCGAGDELVEGLAESARHMGVLFQIQDDTLDLYADKGREARGADIAEGKRSVLVVHALDHLAPEQQKRLSQILDADRESTSAAMIAEALVLLEAAGSLAFALDEIRRRKARALAVPAVAAHAPLSALVAGMCDLFLEPIKPLLSN
jgi:geranylgeranyl pyrophosphate synthase